MMMVGSLFLCLLNGVVLIMIDDDVDDVGSKVTMHFRCSSCCCCCWSLVVGLLRCFENRGEI
jgi:hypothetical protein